MSNPGRRARRQQRHGVHAPTRMTEFQRNHQAEANRFDGMLDHLDIAATGNPDAETLEAEYLDEEIGVADGTAAADTRPQPDYTRPIADREASAYEFAVMAALQDKPVYQKSVHPDEIRRRRARNRAARKARKAGAR